MQDRQSLSHIVVELDDQNRFARLRFQFEQIARGLKEKLALCLIEQRAIDVFDGGGFEIEQLDRGLHRFVHGRKKDQTQTFLVRQGRDF